MSLFSYTERPFQAESSSEEGSDSEEEGSKGERGGRVTCTCACTCDVDDEW